MAVLARFDADGRWQDTWVCDDWITRTLAAHGVAWGRWPEHALADGSAQTAQRAYAQELQAVTHLCRVHSAAWLETAAQPETGHTERSLGATEIQFFVEGGGLFYLRDGAHRLGLLCDAGDWVALPANLPHVFDAGAAPHLRLLRLRAQGGGPDRRLDAHAAPPLSFDDFVEQVLEWTGDVGA